MLIDKYQYIVHEIKGIIFVYKISANDALIRNYKCIESYISNGCVQFIVSEEGTNVHLLSPMKEFAFGTSNQLMTDTPQFRMQDPNGEKIRRLTYYRSLKSEEFLILGYFKETENFKDILVPAPNVEEEKVEPPLVKTMPYMLKKEGFDDLKPILPMKDIEVPFDAAQEHVSFPQPVPAVDDTHIVSNLPRMNKIPGLGLRPPNKPSTIPIIHRPMMPPAMEVEKQEDPIHVVTAQTKKHDEVEELKINVFLPPTLHYNLVVFDLSKLLESQNLTEFEEMKVDK